MTESDIEVYLPESNLQAEDIPFYALWNNKENFIVKLEVPEGLVLKELYNVALEDIEELNEKSFLIRKTKVNGYLSGIIDSQVDANRATLTKKIRISLIQTTEPPNGVAKKESLYEPEIKLFRPDVILCSEVPKRIKIRRTEIGDVKVDKRLEIVNKGKGIGVVIIKILNKEVSMGYSEGVGKFFEGLMNDLKNNLSQMSKKYTSYSEIIDNLLLFLDRPPNLTKEEREQVKKAINDFDNLIKKDKDFASELSVANNASILKNIEFNADLNAFVAYTKTGAEGKILNYDALKSIKMRKGEHPLLAKMEIYDLGQNLCGEIILPEIILEAEEDSEIPFYEFVQIKHKVELI